MSLTIKKEVWIIKRTNTKKAVLVARENGKFEGVIAIKGLRKQNLTIPRLKKQFKQTRSFNPNVIEIQRFKTGTRAITTKKSPKNTTNTQIQVEVAVANVRTGQTRIFTGFTKKGELSQTKAEQNAIRQAKGSGFIDYDDAQGFDFATKIKKIEFKTFKMAA